MFANLEPEFYELFTVSGFALLLVLTLLETVLGFDNVLYITIESKRVAPNQQARVRRLGTIFAIVLRIVLLFVVLQLIAMFQNPWFTIDTRYLTASVNGHSLITMGGGLFLINTGLKELHHMIAADEQEAGHKARRTNVKPATALFWILVMNIVFSFDTVLSSVALTKNFIIMSLAIVLSGALMVLLADRVARFLQKNRLYEVLGLFILLLVGIMLLSEGAHIAHVSLFGYTIEPLAKSTFYFVIAALVIVDILQGRYQKRLDQE